MKKFPFYVFCLRCDSFTRIHFPFHSLLCLSFDNFVCTEEKMIFPSINIKNTFPQNTHTPVIHNHVFNLFFTWAFPWQKCLGSCKKLFKASSEKELKNSHRKVWTHTNTHPVLTVCLAVCRLLFFLYNSHYFVNFLFIRQLFCWDALRRKRI